MGTGRFAVWSPGIVPVFVLCASAALAQTDPGRQPDAMAFIRVIADVRVDFGGTRPPIERKDMELGTGSGFVVAPSGLLLTSLHVVGEGDGKSRFREEGAEVSLENRRIEVAIGRSGGQGVFEGHVVASDPGNDLAAVQVTAADLPYLPIGDSDAVEAGRPVQVLGFPFGRQVEVGKRVDDGLVPEVTVTAGSFSAARANEEGDTRYLQTDAAVNPGNSGGPMLDEDGYVVGVVKMKLARDAAAHGAGFSVPINLAKDFLDANGLLELVPVVRLRPGVRHTLDWKGLAIESPDGYSDQSTSRVLAEGGELGEIGFRAYRLATPWTVAALEEVLLGGREVPGFVPAPATGGRRQASARPAQVTPAPLRPPGVVGSAGGTDGSGRAFRVEYAIVDRGKEKVVARYLGPADAIAFNLGLIRRSLGSLEAARILADAKALPSAAEALETVSFPEGEGRILAPAGWSREGETRSACGRLPLAENGLSASPLRDYTLVLRALRFATGGPELEQAVSACGQGGAGRAGPSLSGRSAYARRFERLGVAIEVRGVLVPRGPEALLLELEAPVAKLPAIEGLHERWIHAIAAGH